MKRAPLMLFILLSLPGGLLWGQADSTRALIFEAGTGMIGCMAPEKDYIRVVNDQYYYDYYSSNPLVSDMYLSYLGFKYEYRVFNNRLGLTAGLRYSWMNTNIHKTSEPDYFYVKYNQSGLNTEYARVSEISEKGSYIGIPLELRLYSNNNKIVTLCYKAGISYNMKLQASSDITFFDASMNQYKDEVMSVLETTPSSFTTVYLGMGARIKLPKGWALSVEAYTPLTVIYPEGDYLVSPACGTGVQFLLSIPLNTKKL